jgi:hypothetical protein
MAFCSPRPTHRYMLDEEKFMSLLIGFSIVLPFFFSAFRQSKDRMYVGLRVLSLLNYKLITKQRK